MDVPPLKEFMDLLFSLYCSNKFFSIVFINLIKHVSGDGLKSKPRLDSYILQNKLKLGILYPRFYILEE